MKSQHAHMKQIILPKTVLEFTSLAIDDGFMKKNGLAPLSQKENQDHVIQKVPKKFGIFPACSYKTGKKNQPPTHKKYLWVGGGGYIPWKIMIQIQSTTNLLGQRTKSQKLQKLQSESFFFCLRFVFTIFYRRSFQVLPKKNYPHLKCQFPPKIPI